MCVHPCEEAGEKASKLALRPIDVEAPASMGGSRRGPAVPRHPLVPAGSRSWKRGHLWAEP